MSRRPRRNHSAVFKAKVAIAAIKGDRTIAQIAEQFDVHPNQVTTWKAQLEGGAAEARSARGVSLRSGRGGLILAAKPATQFQKHTRTRNLFRLAWFACWQRLREIGPASA
jgi:transposase